MLEHEILKFWTHRILHVISEHFISFHFISSALPDLGTLSGFITFIAAHLYTKRVVP